MRLTRISLIALAAAFLLAHSVMARAAKKGPQVVPAVDLSRYAGRWYEVARLPNRFQKNCAGEVTAEYALLAGGDIRVVNQCRQSNGQMKMAEGKARLAEKDGPNSKLEVRFAPSFLSFLPFVWGDYWILDLAPDYSYALVGDPGRKYLWFLSRSPRVDEATFRRLTEKAAAEGYDVSRLIRTRQEG